MRVTTLPPVVRKLNKYQVDKGVKQKNLHGGGAAELHI